MTALDTTPRALPPIGQTRYARDIRVGWHVNMPRLGWRLVLTVMPSAVRGHGDQVVVTVRDGLHEQRSTEMPCSTPLATRTPEEQIQWVEARRLEADGGGPVTVLHVEQQWAAILADASTEGGDPE